MNDFTKEELRQIYGFIQQYKQDDYDDMRFRVIEDKIQSMIDNYCEHEWRSSAIDAIYCPHCQKHVECEL